MPTYVSVLLKKQSACLNELKSIEKHGCMVSNYDTDFPRLSYTPVGCPHVMNNNNYRSGVDDIWNENPSNVRSLSYAETVENSMNGVSGTKASTTNCNTMQPKVSQDFDLRTVIDPRRSWITVRPTKSQICYSEKSKPEQKSKVNGKVCFYAQTKSLASKELNFSVLRTGSATKCEMSKKLSLEKEKGHTIRSISSELGLQKNNFVRVNKNISRSLNIRLPEKNNKKWITVPLTKTSRLLVKDVSSEYCQLHNAFQCLSEPVSKLSDLKDIIDDSTGGLDTVLPCKGSKAKNYSFPETKYQVKCRKLLSTNSIHNLAGGGQNAQFKVNEFSVKLKSLCLNSKNTCRIMKQQSILRRSRQKCCELKKNNVYSTLLIPFFNENASSIRAMVCCEKKEHAQSLVTTHIPICVGGKAKWDKSDEKTLTGLLCLYGWKNAKRYTIREKDCPDEIAYSLNVVAKILGIKTNENCDVIDALSLNPSIVKNYIECGFSSDICKCEISTVDENVAHLKRKSLDTSESSCTTNPLKRTREEGALLLSDNLHESCNNTPKSTGTEIPHIIELESGCENRKRSASSVTPIATKSSKCDSIVTTGSTIEQTRIHNVVWTKKTYTLTPENVKKEISIESVSCLRLDGPTLEKYVNDEVIYSFCSLVSQICTGTNNIIDPLLVSYLDIHPNYKHPDYPKRNGIMYFPICRNAHWVLAIFKFENNTVQVMDSKQHVYYGDEAFVHEATREIVIKVWQSFTDTRLQGSHLKNYSRAQIAEQLDEYNCGIYVCYHLVRLLMNITDDPSHFTPRFADQYRVQISRFLRDNFHIRDENSSSRRASHIENLFQATDYFQTLVVNDQNIPLPNHSKIASIESNNPDKPLKDCKSSFTCTTSSNVPVDDSSNTLPRTCHNVTISLDTGKTIEQLFELSEQLNKTTLSDSGDSCNTSRYLKNICANSLNKTVLMSSKVLKRCDIVQKCCIYNPYTNSYANLVLPIVIEHNLCAVVIVKKAQFAVRKGKTKSKDNVTIIVAKGNTKYSCSRYEKNTLCRLFKLHGINEVNFNQIQVRNDNNLELLEHARSILCDEKFPPENLLVNCIRGNLSSLKVFTESKQGNLLNGFCYSPEGKCGCPLSVNLNMLCSHLTSLQNKSSKKFAVFSPRLLEEKTSILQNCAIWNKQVNNYEFALMPIEIGDVCGLIHHCVGNYKNNQRNKTTLYVANTSDANKCSISQQMRKNVKRLLLNHGLQTTGIHIESELSLNAVGALCYKALSLIHSIDFSLEEFFHRWQSHTNTIQNVRGCAHQLKCSCKLYGGSKAKSGCAIYHETHLLPNGSTIGSMNIKCVYCEAWRFANETAFVCCQNGKVEVTDTELSQSVPDIMKEHKITVMNDKELFSKTMFMNNSMSLGSNIYRQRENIAPGEKSLIIQGKYSAGICHVVARNPNEPAFAQLYFTAENIVNSCLERYKWQSKKTKTYMLKVMEVLKNHNVLVQSYVSCDEAMKEECERLKNSGITDEPRLLMNIKDNRNDIPDGVLSKDVHKGRINAPVINNQVAVIWVGEIPNKEDLVNGIRVRERGGQTVAPHFSANLDGLLFVILFPNGEIGYIHDVNMYKRPGGPGTMKNENEDILKHEDSNVDGTTDNLQGHDDSLSERMEAKEKYVSRREFTIYMLSRRGEPKNLKFHRILGWGKLSAQWILFSWVRVESDRISHISANVTEYRGVEQSELFKFLDSQLQTTSLPLGSLTQLPSSYPHAMKWFQKQYENSMTVVQKEGNPDLFITFTGNSEWKEIKDNLIHEYDSWITDPMLCARVFHEKLQQLLHDIVHAHVFGKVKALQYSIEFQKRGMPHAHILITLETKLIDPSLVDKIVSAELPELPPKDDPTYDSVAQLRAKVIKHMIHRPCWGKEKMACRQGCVNRPKCQKSFPHEYSENTFVSNHGKHIYRRRKGNPFPVGSRNVVMANNCDVVPYNKYLLSKYDCHINVEVVCSATACKYIFKYIYKGPDQLVLELIGDKPENVAARKQRTVRDEKGNSVIELNMAKEHVNARYLGQVEASYRLLGYALQGSLHTVITLKPHTPGNKYICFRKGIIPTEVKKSELEAYFDLIKTARDKNTQDKNLLWTEVAEQFIFDTRKRSYIKRKRSKKVVAAIRFVPPKFTELYAMRLLLTKKATSGFEDIRCVGKILHPTFMDAAVAAGYIHEDEEWDRCLTLVSHHARPKEIRRVFASLLIYCQIVNGRELWEKHKHSMRNRFPNWTADKLDQFSLSHIDWILRVQGSSLNQCNMTALLNDRQLDSEAQFDPDSSQNDSVDDLDMAMSFQLNVKQKHALDTVMNAVQERMGVCKRMFFLYGKAGCGKTFLYNRIIAECRSTGKRVVAVASTGIAATLLWGGRTAHSTFKIPIQLNDKTVIHMDANSPVAEHLRNADIFLWDEAPMQSRFAMEAVDRMLRDIVEPHRKHLPFGGTTVVFGGDWSQFLPVVRCFRGADLEAETINVTLKNSNLWDDMQVLTLDLNMRVSQCEKDHMHWLRCVGEGTCQYQNSNCIDLPEEMYVKNEGEIINWLYTPEVMRSSEKLSKVALLSVRNDDTLNLNEKILQKISGKEFILHSADESANPDNGLFGLTETVEYINTLTPSGMPPHKLTLRIGCIVMLLRNIDVTSNLCNGTRLELLDVLSLGNTSVLKCRQLNNSIVNSECYIQRIPLTYSDDQGFSGMAFRRVQFPVRLSFAMTINKSQGQTFDKVGLILRTPAFAHGSTYVALSRATSKDGIRVTMNREFNRTDGSTFIPVRNIVYQSLINDN